MEVRRCLYTKAYAVDFEPCTCVIGAFLTLLLRWVEKIKRTNPDLIIKARGQGGKSGGILSKALIKHALYCYDVLLQRGYPIKGQEENFMGYILQYKFVPDLKRRMAVYYSRDNSAKLRWEAHQFMLRRLLKEKWLVRPINISKVA